jgi:hypothetical protein
MPWRLTDRRRELQAATKGTELRFKFKVKISIRILVSPVSAFQNLIFSAPALFDSDLPFPIFYFPKFSLFLPCLVRFFAFCAFCGGLKA